MALFGFGPRVDRLKAQRDVQGLTEALRFRVDSADSASQGYVDTRRAAAAAFGELQDPLAIESLVIAAFCDESSVAESSRRALAQIDPGWRDTAAGQSGLAEAVGPSAAVLSQMKWPSTAAWRIHWCVAAEVLREIGVDAAVEPLVDAATVSAVELSGFHPEIDDMNTVRGTVVEALRAIGGTRAIELLATRLQDNDPTTAASAAEVLGELGDARAVEPLLDALPNHTGPVADALTELADGRAVEPLLEMLDAPDLTDGETRAVIKALGRIGDPRAAEPLTELLVLPAFAAEAADALRQIGTESDTAAVERLAIMLSTGDAGARLAAVNALRSSRDPRASEALVEAALAKTIPEHIRKAAEKAVIREPNPCAVAPLVAALERDEMPRKTLEAGKRMLGHLVAVAVDKFEADDLHAVMRLEDGARVVIDWDETWDSYEDTRKSVSRKVPVNFGKQRESAEAELQRRSPR